MEQVVALAEDQLATFERESLAVDVRDDVTETAALQIVTKCRANRKELDEERKALTDPLREKIERIAAPFKKSIAFFEQIEREMERRVGLYRAERARVAAEQQRKALADAAAKKAEEEAKAQAAREEAELARASGDEKAAVKLEAKAEKAELAAATVVAPVVPQQAKTVDLGNGTKATFRPLKDWALESGLPRDESYYRDDPRLKTVPDEFFILDAAKIGKVIRAGGKVPGILVIDKPSVSGRKA